MSLNIEIRAAVTCDEVRREDNGKGIAIGIYTGDILVPEFPANLRLSWLLLGKSTGTGERLVEIEIRSAHTVSAQSKITGGGDSDFALVLPGIPVTFNQPGSLVLAVMENGEWQELVSKKVGLLSASTGP